jgi:hypothetical protein
MKKFIVVAHRRRSAQVQGRIMPSMLNVPSSTLVLRLMFMVTASIVSTTIFPTSEDFQCAKGHADMSMSGGGGTSPSEEGHTPLPLDAATEGERGSG